MSPLFHANSAAPAVSWPDAILRMAPAWIVFSAWIRAGLWHLEGLAAAPRDLCDSAQRDAIDGHSFRCAGKKDPAPGSQRRRNHARNADRAVIGKPADRGSADPRAP
jgi:hypothetical protein